MNKLTTQELTQINGGGFIKAGTAIIFGAITAFITGVINGLQRPLTCASTK